MITDKFYCQLILYFSSLFENQGKRNQRNLPIRHTKKLTFHVKSNDLNYPVNHYPGFENAYPTRILTRLLDKTCSQRYAF